MNKVKNIDIQKFLDKFNANYASLDDNNDAIAGFKEAVSFFDVFIKDHGNFVGVFARHRWDFISSDRESAAFIFTLEDFNLI